MWCGVFISDYRICTQKRPRKTKKERKAELREYRYKKWLAKEPSRWCVIKHIKWALDRPEQ